MLKNPPKTMRTNKLVCQSFRVQDKNTKINCNSDTPATSKDQIKKKSIPFIIVLNE